MIMFYIPSIFVNYAKKKKFLSQIGYFVEYLKNGVLKVHFFFWISLFFINKLPF